MANLDAMDSSEETVKDPEDTVETTESDGDAAAVLDAAAAAVDPLEERLEITPLDFPRRLLLVHAHPDDETIGTGVTMAKYVSEGALVTLVTCTLGEEGEVLVPELEHLAAGKDDRLGPQRISELSAAMRLLGVTDHRFLGGPGRWRDSGMMGLPTNDRPDCFWQADLEEATRELVAVMREVRPQVVITYDERGGYGHPDHIQAHRVAVAAFAAAGDPARWPDAGEPWTPSKLYYSALPKSVLQAGIDYFRERGDSSFWGEDVTSADQLPMGTPDELVTTMVDGTAFLDAKMDAMRAHATQIAVDGPFFALADGVGRTAFGQEYYSLVEGEIGDRDGERGAESDLFSGIQG
ncbi:MAG: N-acetyl-D-myo-inositol-2-amino-2-deoxy-alpha-D-glucopyranoside deacetylase [Frankiales bacterium]|jgi:N-acetyl-1-D-myo-inositol-2-amino-2-deoxy-alpha-D-glucopyranoside deacetylase|nr:N-acetyl-D-myo-inositol-2-amino-2-deoxy-alpha-D-glucopyranoside deacetylase [Frankiales bacterium]MDX6245158.1 N-acetyl-D-myo-inositol-2-amino-2-deoxy-alpha-D-glucopyranoside deacetylase [Frankiales bacterium]